MVNFGKAGWINKARQQPDRVKDVLNKIKSSGFNETFRAIKTKLDYPMVMGYSAVGTVAHSNEKFSLSKGDRVFTNSVHQEQALIDYNMCVKIPDEVDTEICKLWCNWRNSNSKHKMHSRKFQKNCPYWVRITGSSNIKNTYCFRI